MPRLAYAALLGATALAAGCRLPFSGAPAETYALTAPVGDSLPVVLWTNEGDTLFVVADTIRLRDDGTGEHLRLHRFQAAHSREVAAPRRSGTRFGYVVRGDRIEISYPCPPNANCFPPPHEIGRITHEAIALESLPEGFVHHRR